MKNSYLLFCLSFLITAPASAQTFSIVSGNNQTLTVGTTSPTGLEVTICQPGQIVCNGRTTTTIVFQVETDAPYANLCATDFYSNSCATSLSATIPALGSTATVYLAAAEAAGSYTVTATDQSNNATVTFHMTNLPGPPAVLAGSGGGNLVEGASEDIVMFLYDYYGNLIPQATPITYQAPSTEPSGNFSGSRSVTLNTVEGETTASFTADNTAGSYKVHVTAPCANCALDFPFTNIAPVSITVATNPAGLMFQADGQNYQSPKTFAWAPNSQHYLTALSPQATVAGQNGATVSANWKFVSWSDPSANNNTFTTGTSSETLTATFQTTGTVQYLLSVTASPSSQGSLSVNPPASDGTLSDGTYSGHYNAGTVVQITVTAATGFLFDLWEGNLSGTANPQSVTMNSSIDATAVFVPAFPATIATNPAGLSISVDGQTYTAPQTLQWAQMSQHTIATSSPQTLGSAQEKFANWSDGGAISHTVTIGGAAATYTANFTQTISALTFTCGTAASPQVGSNYTLTCTASGGLSPYKFSVSAGSLPPGLSLTTQGATASVVGSPTAPGSYSFTLQASDSSSPALTATQSLSGTVAGLPSVLSVSPAAGLTFAAYQGRANPPTQTLSVTSSGGSTSFTVTNMPAWVQVSPTGGTTPAILTVTATTGALPTGLATGSIAITPSNGQAAVAVTVQANVSAFSIGAGSPVSESLAAGSLKNDSLAVTTIDNGAATVQAAATAATGGNWLKLPSATLAAPGALAFTIDATTLTAGNYTGAIALTCATTNPCSPLNVTVNLAVSQSAPTVAISQVLNATGEAAFISQNTWIEIKGTNLSQTTRIWENSDFDPTTGLMPTKLDGVSATVNGKAAYVYYISPTQVNVLTPLDSALGTVGVQVTNSVGTSPVASVAMLPNSLGFFAFNSDKYAAATHTNGSLLGPTSLYPGQTTPAKAGETIVLYANGFGQTNPPIIAGLAVQQGVLANNPVIAIGGLPANVIYAAVVSPGLYQFNVVVPANAPLGDLTLLATYNGVSTQPGVFVTVGQ